MRARSGASATPRGGGMRRTTASSSSGTLLPSLAEMRRISSGFDPMSSCSSCARRSGSAPGRSILLSTGMISSPASIARNRLESVCAWIPCEASTTRIAPSHAWSERGITIKLNAVRMNYHARDGGVYELNLIDTPGHVDFTYEVSRSLQACEGAILVVDASQGIQAQTLSNLFLAMDAGLEIIPVLNKIDLPGAEPERRAQELHELIGSKPEEILRISAKEGSNVPELLEAVVRRIPPPRGVADAPLRALIFDSYYDRYRGAIPSIRVVDGTIRPGMKIAFGAHKDDVYEVDEVGYLQLGHKPTEQLEAGEVGYFVANVRGVRDTRSGDTVLDADHRDLPLLPGYRDIMSMVFAGLYPTNAEQFEELRDALAKLQLN